MPNSAPASSRASNWYWPEARSLCKQVGPDSVRRRLVRPRSSLVRPSVLNTAPSGVTASEKVDGAHLLESPVGIGAGQAQEDASVGDVEHRARALAGRCPRARRRPNRRRLRAANTIHSSGPVPATRCPAALRTLRPKAQSERDAHGARGRRADQHLGERESGRRAGAGADDLCPDTSQPGAHGGRRRRADRAPRAGACR